MDIDVTFRGYRCFSPDFPATLQLRDDIVALVGVNNSGKSTLMKALYEMRQAFATLRDTNILRHAITGQTNLPLPREVKDPAELFWHFGQGNIEIDIRLPTVKDVRLLSRITMMIARETYALSLALYDFNGRRVPQAGAGIWGFGPDSIRKDGYEIGTPTMMMEALGILVSSFYYPSVRHVTAFTPEGTQQGRYYDITSGKPFIEHWAHAQLGAGKISTEKTDEIVQDIRRIFRYDRLDIHADQSHWGLLVTANGKSTRLSELGTGIAQFILLLGNITFAEPKPSYILIDEPESNLHPSLQLDFLSAVASRASVGVIFATHSLGLARQAADRLFAFSPMPTGCTMSPFNRTDNLAQIVGELSFGRSDFAPARKLLLVEGQTDVLTMENLLAGFGKEHDFAIISLNGKSGIHPKRKPELEHMLALSLEMRAIIDSERTTANEPVSTQRLEFQEACRLLNIRCHILERTAIENYFTQRAIDAALGAGNYTAFGHYGVCSGPRWSKNSNWRIARDMLKSEVERTDLGEFLDSV